MPESASDLPCRHFAHGRDADTPSWRAPQLESLPNKAASSDSRESFGLRVLDVRTVDEGGGRLSRAVDLTLSKQINRALAAEQAVASSEPLANAALSE